jgi:hypothetical protein
VRGFVANPAATLLVVPPSGATFPVTAYLSANDARLYFSLPGSASAAGPSLTVSIPSSAATPSVAFSIFPDHDGASEDHAVSATFVDALGRLAVATYPVHVTDLDRAPATPTLHVTVDYSQDTTGFFSDPAKRAIVEAAAADWGDLLADPGSTRPRCARAAKARTRADSRR